ncbi:MAG: CPBP family intramembrane metalloprotease [Bacilli bacterium]|jgi:membrane protease YdiL (CAAX protease family)|nr:CPBP family intramembrane metalloprotease [Bacilli bacterium]
MSRIKAIINIIIYILVQLFVLVWISFHNNNQNEIISLNTMALYMVPILVLIFIINFNYLKDKISYALKHYKIGLIYGFVGFMGYLVISFIFNIIILSINGQEIDVSKNEEVLRYMIGNSSMISSFLLLVLIAPLVEELIFRVSLLGLLNKDQKNKRWYLYILAAFIFALVHEYDFIINFNLLNCLLFLQYFIPSLLIILVYYLSNHNLLATYFLHILNNALALMISILLT